MSEKEKAESRRMKDEKRSSGLVSFWAELKRRKVMRVAITYAVVGWIVMQVASLTFEGFGIPIWAFRFVMLMVLLGFPLAIILAWAFELSPEGIKTTKAARIENPDAESDSATQKKRNWFSVLFAAAIPTLIFGALAVFFYLRSDTPVTPDQREGGSNQTPGLVEYDKSIAVLPFTNMSANEEHAYFADGVHETILTDLANLRELRVISRTSVLPYRNSNKSMKAIGAELGVAYILAGSMQRDGNQFRLTAQLIDARIDEHLWAKNFDGELTNIFSVQSQLAKDVAQGLQAILSPQEEQQIDRPKSASIEAYEWYLKAREIFNNTGRISSEEALGYLEKAVELDPAFTDAWLWIARSNGNVYLNARDRSPDRERRAKEAIDMAVQLEPNNPKVAVGLGYYYYQCHLDYDRARSYVEPVFKELPNNFDAVRSLAPISRRDGRWSDAVKYYERAHLLDPKDTGTLWNLGSIYLYLRDWGNLIKTYDQLIAILPDNFQFQYERSQIDFIVYGSKSSMERLFANENTRREQVVEYYEWLIESGNLEALKEEAASDAWVKPSFSDPLTEREWAIIDQGVALQLLGESDQSKEIADHFIEQAELQYSTGIDNSRTQTFLGWAYALSGNYAKARTAVDRAIAIRSEYADANRGTSIALQRAIILAWLGDKDEAVKELTRLSRKPSPINYYTLQNNLYFHPLRNHPGFQALLNDPALKEPLPIRNNYR
jgi:TolB-like protein/Flp pilus assembly protein TadD